MKTWLKRLAGLAVVVQAGVAWAGDSPWTLRLGASYRDFGDIDFNGGVEFRNWGRANTAGPYGVQNVATVPPDAINTNTWVFLDEVRWDGDSDGVDSSDKFAPIIGFRYDLTPECKQGLAVVGNFQYYHLDVNSDASGAAGAPGSFTWHQYQHFLLDPDNDGFGELVGPGLEYFGPPGTTAFAVKNEFEMDLYVLDLGIEGRATVMDRIDFTLALGPSLTIADADYSQSQQASWGEQALQGYPAVPAGSYAEKTSDSETDFLVGAYAALGVSVDVTKSWSVGVEYRYDYVNGDAGTSQAELDLSGSSGILRVGYRF